MNERINERKRREQLCWAREKFKETKEKNGIKLIDKKREEKGYRRDKRAKARGRKGKRREKRAKARGRKGNRRLKGRKRKDKDGNSIHFSFSLLPIFRELDSRKRTKSLYLRSISQPFCVICFI